ncbi:MAG: hypothetical protein U0797_18780 [Gemmataceae bacterium]
MTALTLLVCLATAGQPDKSDRDALVGDARAVLAAVVESARARGKADTGDALTARYVRAAAVAAGRLPEGRSGRAFALALGVGLDTSDLMRRNPAVSATWRRVETDQERKNRLAVLGTPTLHGRHDLAQHFAVSMALTAVLGERKAEAAGLLKELLDAQEGGSGFSFADLASDLAGIEFARAVIARPARLAAVAKSFEPRAFCPPPKGLPEGLSLAEFERRYGGLTDARFRAARDDLARRVKKLQGFDED